MSVVGNNRSRRYNQRILGSAIPLGQHDRSPDQVMPLPEAPPTGAYPGLAAPAAARGCCRCEKPAALLQPTTGRVFCAEHWMSEIVMGSLD